MAPITELRSTPSISNESTLKENYSEKESTTKTPEFSKFAKTLRDQDTIAREKGRTAAIKYIPDGQTSKTTFPTSKSLEEYLSSALKSEADSEIAPCPKDRPLRRLIILEDLPRNYVEVLGSQLKINPTFFASHYADPITNRIAGRRFMLNRPGKDSFILQSPQMLCMNIDGQDQHSGVNMYQLDAHVHRSIMKGPKEGEADLASCFGELWNVMSFWSIKLEESGWIALVLTGPPLRDIVRHSTTGKVHKISINEGAEENGPWMQYPSLTARLDLPENIDSRLKLCSSPRMLSTFGELLSAYETGRTT